MATKTKRATRSTNPLGTPAFKIPNGTFYKPTAADGVLGGFAGMLPGSLTGGLKSSLPTTGNLGLYNTSPYLGFQTPTSSARSLGAFQGIGAVGGAGISAGPLLNPAPVVQAKTFIDADGVVHTTTGVPQIPNTPSAFNPNVQPSTTGAQTGQVARPEGTFNPNASNAQQWKDYWNAQAKNPTEQQQQAPKVMSRKQIWEMKAKQRRKRIAEEYWDSQGSSGSVVSAPAPEVIAPQWTSAVNWRIASG